MNTGGLEGLIALLSVTDGTHSFSFDPLAIPDNKINSVGSRQNSENMGFLGGLYDPNAAATYTFDLTQCGASP